MKRTISVMLVLLALALCFGCAQTPVVPQDSITPQSLLTPTPTLRLIETPTPEPTPTPILVVAKKASIGFVVRDDGSYGSAAMMYGFLNTAQTLGYTSVLFRYGASGAVDALTAVQNAFDDECEYIAITNPAGANDEAIAKAGELGMKVIVVNDESSLSDTVVANISIDDSNYVEELCIAAASRMQERKLETGWILLYGQGTGAVVERCRRIISEQYPSYGVVAYAGGAGTQEQETQRLAEYLYYNRQFGGMVALGESSSRIARDARQLAQDRLKADGAVNNPNPPAEFANLPAVGEDVTNQISISIFGTYYSADNIELLDSSGIYGLSIMPYYDVTVYAVMVIDNLINERTITDEMVVGRIIVRYDTLDRYVALHDEICELFGLTE